MSDPSPSEAGGNLPIIALPPIPLNLREHKVSIAIHWAVIILSNSVLPLALYFGLTTTTSITDQVAISITSTVIGVPALWLWVSRGWKLFVMDGLRPIGTRNRWEFDYFHWQITIGVVYCTVLLVFACMVSAGLRLFSLFLPLIVIQTCVQFVLCEVFYLIRIRTPFPISSVRPGCIFPPGVVVVVEDICAVDGNLGRPFRSALHGRVTASEPLRNALRRLDCLWGISGLALSATLIGLVFGLDNAEIGFAIAFLTPWIWALGLTVVTIRLVRQALAKEGSALHATMRGSDSN